MAKNPQKSTNLADKLLPLMGKVFEFVEVATPYVLKAHEKILIAWEIIRPHKDWAPAVFGFFLVFFGGRFLTTIAAVEAIRIIGFGRFISPFKVLWQNYQVGMTAAIKDEEQNNHPATNSQEKALRMAKVMLKSVDPRQVTGAASGVYEVMLAVVATLRLKFAAAVTLGCSMGDVFFQAADKFARPKLEQAVPADYHKWIEPLVGYTCKAIGVSLAWLLQRIMSAVHCSLRGAQLIVTRGQEAAVKSGLLKREQVIEQTSAVYTGLVSFIALVGFLNQVSYNFGLPFPLNLLFLPVYLIEFVLTQLIGTV